VIASELAEYAEAPSAFNVWPPGFRRVLNERYCLVLGPSRFFAEVQRPRLAGVVEDTVAEIRTLAAERGHGPTIWWIGGAATPDDLEERLRELGFVEPEDRTHVAVALAIAEEPAFGPVEVHVRKAETFDDYLAAREVLWEAFATPAEKRDAERPGLEQAFHDEQSLGATAAFVALLDDEPVGAGRSAFCERGALLFGGGVLRDARGRGAYRALVRARWDEAVRRGTPALVTQAAPTSEPILRRLGFEEVTRLRRLNDAGS
jgi:GNAT superfamily N-acetyltransferase